MKKRYDPAAAARRAEQSASTAERSGGASTMADERRTAAGRAIGHGPVLTVDITQVQRSPYQPADRPSPSAVEELRRCMLGEAGLGWVTGPEGRAILERLSAEARRLAELAHDIAEHGIREPLAARRLPDGGLELVSGHRRLAAALLLGKLTIAVVDRGPMSDEAAESELYRANLHRKDFTVWQQARLVEGIRARRLSAGFHDSVRTLADVIGLSYPHVHGLLKIAAALPPALAARLGGDAALSRLSYRQLEAIGKDPCEESRERRARRALGIEDASSPPVEATTTLRSIRGGGFELRCRRKVEVMDHTELRHLREELEMQLGRVAVREAALGAAGPGGAAEPR